jgi:hypothetical protein
MELKAAKGGVLMPFPTLVDHIQRLRRLSSYTRYEIDRDLLRLGYDPVEIDEAWHTINFPVKPVRLISNLRFWLVFVEYVVGLIFLYFLLNFWFPGTIAGFLIVLLFWIISSVGVKFLEKWDKVVSKALLYGAVVVGCYIYAALSYGAIFIWFLGILSALQNCRGGCYP